MPTHSNAVGKVKNTKLYNFRLVRPFHSLDTTLYAAISLEVTRKCSHALPFSRGKVSRGNLERGAFFSSILQDKVC